MRSRFLAAARNRRAVRSDDDDDDDELAAPVVSPRKKSSACFQSGLRLLLALFLVADVCRSVGVPARARGKRVVESSDEDASE